MSKSQKLKSYIRVDGSGRVIPQTEVLRVKKPTSGKWVENQAYICCTNVTMLFTPSSPAITSANLLFYCNGTLVSTLKSSATSTTLASLIIILNNAWGSLGTFSASGSTIQLVMTADQKKLFCPTGTLTFTVVAN